MHDFPLSLTYDDIGLKPISKSTVVHRDDLNTKMRIFGRMFDLPIIVAPMESVVGGEMAKQIYNMGGLSIIPRITGFVTQKDIINRIARYPDDYNIEYFAAAIPATGDYLQQAEWLVGMGIHMICIDVANGFSSVVETAVKELRENFGAELDIITGNVASVEGYQFLSEIGVDGVRVGIGGGSVCTTSIATGVGVGQASIVREIALWRDQIDTFYGHNPDNKFPLIIADGGIRSPGDVAKAIALGADVVMAGRVFAGCTEAPGDTITINERKYKAYAGQASMKIKGQKRYIEGTDLVLPHSGAASGVWTAFAEGLKSSMSYMNAITLEELRFLSDGHFVRLSSEAKRERTVHAI